MPIDGISTAEGKNYITLTGFGTLIERRFHAIQERIIQLLRSKERHDREAALFCIDCAQGYTATLGERARAKLVSLGFLGSELTEAVRLTCRVGFRKSYPGDKGYLRGYSPINPFPPNSIGASLHSPKHIQITEALRGLHANPEHSVAFHNLMAQAHGHLVCYSHQDLELLKTLGILGEAGAIDEETIRIAKILYDVNGTSINHK